MRLQPFRHTGLNNGATRQNDHKEQLAQRSSHRVRKADEAYSIEECPQPHPPQNDPGVLSAHFSRDAHTWKLVDLLPSTWAECYQHSCGLLFIFQYKTLIVRVLHIPGGGSGIRTHGSLRIAGFQDRCFQPLSHPSNQVPVADLRRISLLRLKRR